MASIVSFRKRKLLTAKNKNADKETVGSIVVLICVYVIGKQVTLGELFSTSVSVSNMSKYRFTYGSQTHGISAGIRSPWQAGHVSTLDRLPETRWSKIIRPRMRTQSGYETLNSENEFERERAESTKLSLCWTCFREKIIRFMIHFSPGRMSTHGCFA